LEMAVGPLKCHIETRKQSPPRRKVVYHARVVSCGLVPPGLTIASAVRRGPLRTPEA